MRANRTAHSTTHAEPKGYLTRRDVLRIGAMSGAAALLGSALPGATALAQKAQATRASELGQIEPGAGTWKTWVLNSGSQLRPTPPPDEAASRAELQQLRALADRRDAAA